MTDQEPSLTLWTVTENPSDYPGLFVARKWLLHGPTTEVLTAPSLALLRAQLPAGLWRFPPAAGDDPVIVEVWI